MGQSAAERTRVAAVARCLQVRVLESQLRRWRRQRREESLPPVAASLLARVRELLVPRLAKLHAPFVVCVRAAPFGYNLPVPLLAKLLLVELGAVDRHDHAGALGHDAEVAPRWPRISPVLVHW